MQSLPDSANLFIQSIGKSWFVKSGIWNHWNEALYIFLNVVYLLQKFIYSFHIVWSDFYIPSSCIITSQWTWNLKQEYQANEKWKF